jgi:hypothetical protein
MKLRYLAMISLLVGSFYALLAEDLQLIEGWRWWFLFGSSIVTYSCAFAEVVLEYRKWWSAKPAFKGFEYWVEVALDRLGIEIVKKGEEQE